MKLPELNELATSRDMIDVFGGYNHNLRISDGEFYDMKNLTSLYYPILSPRQQRGVLCETLYLPAGLIEKDALCYVTVGAEGRLIFVINNKEYGLKPTEIDASEERSLVSMGAYVIIMPDKQYVNTLRPDKDYGYIEYTFNSNGETKITFSLCKADGTELKPNYINSVDPINDSEYKDKVSNGFLWLDTSQSRPSLKQYSEANNMWSSVTSTYVKIEGENIGAGFNEYDGVKISGITNEDLSDLNNTMVIYSKGENYIVVIGIIDPDKALGYTEYNVIVERFMPEMDFIIESNNRLWGCRYGFNKSGEVVNELYACKQGDFKNWNCFMGISTDSYYVSLGTDGPFTGAFSYLGYPTFFKENCLHTVYGNYPAEYQVQDTACRGVQKYSHKSLAMVNEVLYYKSRTGICAYSGSLPTEISSVLGDKSYSEAVACAHKGKYYISMKDSSNGEYSLFVCDAEKGVWHKEDNLYVKQFCPIDEEIYYIDGEEKRIGTLFGKGTKDTKPIRWMAETGIIGCSSPDKKYISRLSVRLSMELKSRIRFYIQYDSSGVWENICSLTGNTLKTFTLPIRPKRCDHFRLKIEGEGPAKIFSISKITEQGSDI